MFWGVTILGGRRYTQTVEKSYHISKAALEIPVDGKNPNKRVQLMLEQNKTNYLLCNLDTDKIVQVDLDLIFTEGEEVTFYLNGDGCVHLSGYVLDFEDDLEDYDGLDDEELSEEESEDEEVTNANAKRVLKPADSASAKKAKVDSTAAVKAAAINGFDDDEDDDDDDDANILGDLDEELDDSDDEEDDEEDEEDEEDDVPQQKPAQKPAQKPVNGQAGKAQVQQQKGTPAKQNQPHQNAKNFGSAGKPNNHTPKGGQQQNNQNQNKFGQKGQNTPQGQKQPNQNQSGQKGGPQQQNPQQKGQFNQNKQQFNNKKSFTPDQKASKGNFNKFNKNQGRKSFN